MSRPLRLDHAGAVWHVTSRGNERREIFRDDEDREWFLTILGRVVQTLRWRVHAYVLMGNHYHLLVETPEPTLSRGMRHLNGVYTQWFNRRHDRHEAALKLLEFSPALGIQGWAASQLATAAERLAQENRRFRQSLRRIQQSLAELTNVESRRGAVDVQVL